MPTCSNGNTCRSPSRCRSFKNCSRTTRTFSNITHPWRRYTGYALSKLHPDGDTQGYVFATAVQHAQYVLQEEFGG